MTDFKYRIFFTIIHSPAAIWVKKKFHTSKGENRLGVASLLLR